MQKSATLVFPMAGGGRERLWVVFVFVSVFVFVFVFVFAWFCKGGVTDAEKCNPCISDGWRGEERDCGS